MVDAQGKEMKNHGSRKITLDLGPAMIQEEFYASDVGAPLISLGRLLKKGWSLDHRNGLLHLCNDPEEIEVPVSFRRNSLVVDARVFMVRDDEVKDPEEECVRATKEGRIIVQPHFNIHGLSPGWNFLDCGDPCILKRDKVRLDPSDDMSVHLWKYRTTLVFRQEAWARSPWKTWRT